MDNSMWRYGTDHYSNVKDVRELNDILVSIDRPGIFEDEVPTDKYFWLAYNLAMDELGFEPLFVTETMVFLTPTRGILLEEES